MKSKRLSWCFESCVKNWNFLKKNIVEFFRRVFFVFFLKYLSNFSEFSQNFRKKHRSWFKFFCIVLHQKLLKFCKRCTKGNFLFLHKMSTHPYFPGMGEQNDNFSNQREKFVAKVPLHSDHTLFSLFQNWCTSCTT